MTQAGPECCSRARKSDAERNVRKTVFGKPGCGNYSRYACDGAGVNDITARVPVTKSFQSTPDYTMSCRERGSVILCVSFCLAEVCCPIKVPGRGLEPLRISPPDPKSGASANSATLTNCDAHEPRCVGRCRQI